jgi:large subunit ribosomal protein L21
MYAVVTTGGKQYRVEAGSTLVVEKLAGEPGSSVTFDRVLLVGDGETVTVGTPTVQGASVRATVLGEELGPKIVVFKFKQKVKYRRRTGHRQHLTRLHIDAISADGKTVTAEEKAPRPASRPKAAPKAAAEAEPKAKPARRTRSQVATPAEEAAPGAEAPAKGRGTRSKKAADAEPAEPKPRARRGTAAASAEATPAKAEEAPTPRARRSAKPKAEPAEEE